MAKQQRSASDLALVVGFTLLTGVTLFLPQIDDSPLRAVCGVIYVLFVPGYAFLCLLFPKRSTGDTVYSDESKPPIQGELTTVERSVLSVGASLAIAVLVGLLVEVSPWRLGPVSIFGVSAVLTVVAVCGAFVRRSRTAASLRYDPSIWSGVRAKGGEYLGSTSRLEAVFNVVLVVVIVVAMISFVVPQQTAGFTEFYLLSEQDDGSLTAEQYRTELVRGEPQPYVVGVGNHEKRTVNYTMFVKLQRIETSETTETGTIVEERELDRFEVTVEDNSTKQVRHVVESPVSGERLRLVYLLYKGDAPAEPNLDNAYRELHLWVNVSNTPDADAKTALAASPFRGETPR